MGKPCQQQKMATGLSAELMEALMLADYCDEVELFARDNPTSGDHLRDFKKCTSKKYNIDTALFYTRKGNPIASGMYALFGKYSGLTAEEVRKNLVQWADSQRDMVTAAAKCMLEHDRKAYAWWALNTTNRKNPVDEIAL